MAPLVVLMVWMGMASQTFLPSIGASTATVIERTEAVKEIRVESGTSILAKVKEIWHAR